MDMMPSGDSDSAVTLISTIVTAGAGLATIVSAIWQQFEITKLDNQIEIAEKRSKDAYYADEIHKFDLQKRVLRRKLLAAMEVPASSFTLNFLLVFGTTIGLYMLVTGNMYEKNETIYWILVAIFYLAMSFGIGSIIYGLDKRQAIIREPAGRRESEDPDYSGRFLKGLFGFSIVFYVCIAILPLITFGMLAVHNRAYSVVGIVLVVIGVFVAVVRQLPRAVSWFVRTLMKSNRR